MTQRYPYERRLESRSRGIFLSQMLASVQQVVALESVFASSRVYLVVLTVMELSPALTRNMIVGKCYCIFKFRILLCGFN